ncbi:2-isopropylmalate synthase [bacterium]|nr:2-isopropylmalate synthase [bacterium]
MAVQILDSTLREGEQTPGVYFDGHIKLAIADLLDKIGIRIIEAGHPIIATEINQAIGRIARRNLKALIGAHARSLKRDVDAALETGVDFLGIFYCVSEDRLNGIFRRDLTSAIEQLAKIIAYAKQQKPDLVVRYTPEDTVRSNFANVVEASAAAIAAGADIISIADTTGFMIPGTKRNLYDFIQRLREELSKRDAYPQIAVHCHNDRGLALANTIDAYRAGADIIDATVLGLGERAGIVDLAQLLVVLSTDFDEGTSWDLRLLPQLYDLVSRHSGVAIPINWPVIGQNAFTHCAGVHTHAATRNPFHYQSLDPALVERQMDISLDHMSGISSVRWALDKIEVEADNGLSKQILDLVKSIGKKGRTVGLNELPYVVEWCSQNQ